MAMDRVEERYSQMSVLESYSWLKGVLFYSIRLYYKEYTGFNLARRKMCSEIKWTVKGNEHTIISFLLLENKLTDSIRCFSPNKTAYCFVSLLPCSIFHHPQFNRMDGHVNFDV